MKKRDLITMFLCVPGAGLFALGMCMCHIRKKDLFMGLIGLSMMLGSTFSPAQLSELVDELRTMR